MRIPQPIQPNGNDFADSLQTERSPMQAVPSNSTIHAILDQFRDDARNNRDLGDRFERLMQQFLAVDPLYAGLFSDVWLWNEWPLKGQVGDVGIDLVAREKATGDYWAIQCKFYLPEHTLSKADLDSFFTALVKATRSCH